MRDVLVVGGGAVGLALASTLAGSGLDVVVWERRAAPDAIALDRAQSATVKGGSGQTLDWNIAKKVVESISTPVVLAGGLNPENVAEAIRTVQPYAVDVNSGVSNPDGTKDIEKVRAFIKAARK